MENIIQLKLKNSFNRINCYKSLYLTKDLLSKPNIAENITSKKYLSSLGSSPNLSIDKGSEKFYDENYSDDEKFNKEINNERISVNSLEEIKETKFEVIDYTFDLHGNPKAAIYQGNVMTEYEEKFTQKGNPICKLVAKRKQ